MINLGRLSISRVVSDGIRFYQIEGSERKFPSVTTILNVINKPHLSQWEKRLAFEHLTQSIKKRRLISEEFPDSNWFKNIFVEAEGAATIVRDQASDFGTRAHVGLF